MVTTAFTFTQHTNTFPRHEIVEEIYFAFLDIFERLNCTSSHFNTTQRSYSKFNGKLHKRVLAQRFEGAKRFGIAAVPPESDAPGYNAYAMAGLSDLTDKTELHFFIDEPWLQFQSQKTIDIISAFSRLLPWDYGFVFQRPTQNRAMSVALCGVIGRDLSAEDERRTDVWYQTWQAEIRRRKVRDVFEHNIIGPGHLTNEVTKGKTLRDFVVKNKDSVLSELTDHLWLWSVVPEKCETVRKKLLGKDVLIAE